MENGNAQNRPSVPNSSGTNLPRLQVPVETCDCHMHIYDDRFPTVPYPHLRSANASVEDYRLLQKRLGIRRNVVVTPGAYGSDNRCTLDALSQLGANARGVAVVDPTIPDSELRRFSELGVRGIRLNFRIAGLTAIETLEPLSRRIEPLGWHVQLNMPGDLIARHKDILLRLPSPIVFDHVARIPQPEGIHHPGYQVVRTLLDQGKTWIKLSAPYSVTKTGGPAYSDIAQVVQWLVKVASERLVWASDWPHPTEEIKPDDAALLDFFSSFISDEATRDRVFVSNAETLYGFTKSNSGGSPSDFGTAAK